MAMTLHSDRAQMAEAVARQLGACIDQAVAARGRAVIALAGGSTPLAAYRLLAGQARHWAPVIVVPTDERWVNADHPARNDRALAAALTAAVDLQLRSLVPMVAEGPPEAQFAEQALADLQQPFDLVLLGMGLDAHTASLFPVANGMAAAMDLQSSAAAFALTPQPLPVEAPYPRISLGRRRLLDARRHLLLITGADKRAVFEQASAQGDPAAAPIAAFVSPQLNMTVHWSP